MNREDFLPQAQKIKEQTRQKYGFNEVTVQITLMDAKKFKSLSKNRFDARNLDSDQVEKAILKSIRPKSGAKGNSSRQIVADED